MVHTQYLPLEHEHIIFTNKCMVLGKSIWFAVSASLANYETQNTSDYGSCKDSEPWLQIISTFLNIPLICEYIFVKIEGTVYGETEHMYHHKFIKHKFMYQSCFYC